MVGHGALLLGHNHPVVMGKVAEQIRRGTHFGASHENMVRWGEWVCKLVPSAEMVRFFSSGTEATMMAMRLARNLTGKNKILKFDGHFHGWHDLATVAVYEPYEVPTSGGIPQPMQDLVVSMPQGDAGAVRDAITTDGDIAVVILEPSGRELGNPADQPRLHAGAKRQVCTDLEVPLIFDEVITGFRYSPGGYQAEFGITPDMTTMAKIIAGGMPGGAVAGQRRFLEQIGVRVVRRTARIAPRHLQRQPRLFNRGRDVSGIHLRTARSTSTSTSSATGCVPELTACSRVRA